MSIFQRKVVTSLPSNYQYTRTPASVMFKELIGDFALCGGAFARAI